MAGRVGSRGRGDRRIHRGRSIHDGRMHGRVGRATRDADSGVPVRRQTSGGVVVDGNNRSEREAIANRRIFPQSKRFARDGWNLVKIHVGLGFRGHVTWVTWAVTSPARLATVVSDSGCMLCQNTTQWRPGWFAYRPRIE